MFAARFGSGPSCTSRDFPLLSVSGNKIVNQRRQAVFLRGFNHSSAEYSPVYAGSNQFYDDNTPNMIDMAARLGANTLRLPLNQAAWLNTIIGNEGVTGAPYRAAITTLVTRARSYGLYVILELHWNDPRPVPDTVYECSQQQMANRGATPGVADSLAFWSSVATTFKTDMGVLFDLYNEPNVINWTEWRDGGKTVTYFNTQGAGAITYSWVTAGMQEMVNAVRATGAANIIILGGLNYAAALGEHDNDTSGDPTLGWLSHKPSDPLNNLVATTHFYPDQPYVRSAPGSRTFYAPAAATVLVVAASVPVLIGEYGDTRTLPMDGFASGVLPWAETNGLHHLAWTLNDWASDDTLVTSFYAATNPYDSVPNAGEGSLVIPYVKARRLITVPSANISAGKPIFASSSIASAVTNITRSLWNGTDWQSTGYPADISLDVSSVPVAQRTHLILVMSTGNYTGDSVLTAGDTYRAWDSYTIQGNAGAGGGAAPSSGWVDLVTITGNTRRSRSHRFDNVASVGATPYNWLRIHFTVGMPTNASGQNAASLSTLDIVDATNGAFDSWFIFGDSICAAGSQTSAGMGAASDIALANTGYSPVFEVIGVPFTKATDFSGAGTARTQWLTYLADTACHNVMICLGTNDAAGAGAANNYNTAMRVLITDCLAAGKRPWIAKIPWSPDTTRQANTIPLNAKIDLIYSDYGSVVGVGPDFYSFYAQHAEAWIGDSVHPTGDWSLWGKELSRVAVLNGYPGPNSSAWTPPIISLAK